MYFQTKSKVNYSTGTGFGTSISEEASEISIFDGSSVAPFLACKILIKASFQLWPLQTFTTILKTRITNQIEISRV